jgi:alpha-methylacyl-CoA racemase
VSADRGAPLAGVRLVELAALPPTSFTAMLLADLGAEVIRVGREPQTQPGDGLLRHRSAQTWLDLKSEAGRRGLLSLVRGADVLLESNRPGVCERLGIGPADCARVNPRLIYARLSGWGQDGPYAGRPGHDINYLALSGLLYPLGEPGLPPRPPLNLVANLAGGGLTLSLGIVAALYERERSGRGQVLDGAMLDGAIQLSAPMHDGRANGRFFDQRGANMSGGAAPFYQCYETADGRYVAVGAVEPKFYAALIDLLGLPADLRERQHDRELWPERAAVFAAAFATRTRDDWAADPGSAQACVTPVLEPAELDGDAHLRARRALTRSAGGWPEPVPAPRFSAWAGDLPAAEVPLAKVLTSWGLSADEQTAFGDLDEVPRRRAEPDSRAQPMPASHHSPGGIG